MPTPDVSKTSFKDVFEMHFLKFLEKISKCCDIWRYLKIYKHCYNVAVFWTFVFQPSINVAAKSCFWSGFLRENPMMCQYHHNSLYPKIRKLSWKLIYSVSMNAKCLLNFILSESLNKNNSLFLAVNSLGSNYFLPSGNQRAGA